MSDQSLHSPSYPPRQSGLAIAVMVLGIVGLVLLCGYGIGIIPAVIALAMAPSARREVHSSGGRVVGEGFIKAGVVCGWVTVGVFLAAVVIIGIVALVAAASGS